MKIYISHSRHYDFKELLYEPLKQGLFGDEFEFIFPHESSDDPYPVTELFEKKGCDLVIAEVSYPSTGQGIELAVAHQHKIPIYCIYLEDSVVSGSLKTLTSTFLEYEDEKDLVDMVKFLLIGGAKLPQQ